ncbi:MAG: sigma factor, partial [Pseudomonadota bacterium]
MPNSYNVRLFFSIYFFIGPVTLLRMQTYHSDEWQKWMLAALKGDQQAYRLLLTYVRSWLIAYFRKRIQGSSVEDLVQETLLTLHNKRQTFDPDLSFFPWIIAIAKHRWIDHLRKTLKYV